MIELPEEERWVSRDIVDDGATPTITVAAQKMEARLKWEGERDNSGIAVFTVGEEAISTHFTYKYCPE
ncbi:hypothetical protein [Haloprofundus sp. MHR1]|uniref:hypothetical protein n=1 Tax=Haloprofundus sp. MHR1 TaxID=2572921 RepID=UPI0010BE1CA4|nr:hypothetical protein [Haloprofundus sp. MHR1]QCJ46362.1 hypothetical protein FCF25_04170 [Haloprofundus sp. MHR1]